MVKRYSYDVRNIWVYEKSILSEVICHHLAALANPQKFDLSVRLLGSRKARKKLVSFLRSELNFFGPGHAAIQYQTSSKARISKFEVCSVRDAVLCRHYDAAFVSSCFCCGI